MNRKRSLALVCVLALAACGGSQNQPAGGSGGSGPGAGGAGFTLDGGSGGANADSGGDAVGGDTTGGDLATSDGNTPTPIPVTCEIANPQCNDGVDNDNDGKGDSLDLECQGPCDNDEGSFATGIPGDNMDACKQDCFFDGNSGMGDDGCDWNLKCDPANPGGASCAYDPNFGKCDGKQSPKCVRNCQKLTPNGCDCFGCCAVQSGASTINVLLVGTCTADKFGNPTACPRCTQNPDCINTCDKCEVCIGRPAPDPSCTTGGGGPDGGASDGGTTGPTCPTGMQSCGPGGAVAANACGAGFYCQTGCCVRFVVD